MSARPRVALATCRNIPEKDVDEPLLLAALERAGVEARMLVWDDGGALPADVDLVVLRSTWNYAQAPEAFVAWLDALSAVTRVANPVDVVRWNLDKIYLAELEARGVAIVPTAFVARGESAGLEALCSARGWSEVLIKPRISAGSWKTARFGPGSLGEGERFLASLSSERDVLVQPYLSSVEGRGERCLVFLEGGISHAVRKSPRLAGDAESVTPVDVERDERAFAEQVLEPFRERILYGRVDMARDDSGRLVVMELELIEPSLFFAQHPGATDPFARAIARAAGSTSGWPR